MKTPSGLAAGGSATSPKGGGKTRPCFPLRGKSPVRTLGNRGRGPLPSPGCGGKIGGRPQGSPLRARDGHCRGSAARVGPRSRRERSPDRSADGLSRAPASTEKDPASLRIGGPRASASTGADPFRHPACVRRRMTPPPEGEARARDGPCTHSLQARIRAFSRTRAFSLPFPARRAIII